MRSVIMAFSAMGFSLFTGAVLANLFLEDEFNLEALDRGIREDPALLLNPIADRMRLLEQHGSAS